MISSHKRVQKAPRDIWAGRSAELLLQQLSNPPEDGSEFQRPNFPESASEPSLQATLLPSALAREDTGLSKKGTRSSRLLRDESGPSSPVSPGTTLRSLQERESKATTDKLAKSWRSSTRSKQSWPSVPQHASIIRSMRDELEPPGWTPAMTRARGIYKPAPFKASKKVACSGFSARRLSMHMYRDAVLDPEAFKVLQNKIKSAAYTGANGQELGVLFARFDIDGSGELEFNEVERALRHTLKIPKYLVSDDEIRKVCEVLDADGSGAVSVEELVGFVTTQAQDLARSWKTGDIDPCLPAQVKPLSKDILSNGELQRLARAKEEGMRLRKKWRTMNDFGLGTGGTPYTFAQVFCEVDGRAKGRMLPDPRSETGRLASTQFGDSWSSLSGRSWRKLPFESAVLPSKSWKDSQLRSRATM